MPRHHRGSPKFTLLMKFITHSLVYAGIFNTPCSEAYGIVVYGEREAKTGKLSVRVRGVGQEVMSLEELIARLSRETQGYPRRPLTAPMLLSVRPPLP